MLKSRLKHFDPVTVIAASITLALTALSVLNHVFPSLNFVVIDPELATVIESICVIAAIAAFFLCYARFRVTGELRLLLLALAFLSVGVFNLLREAIGAVLEQLGNEPPDVIAYFWLIAKTMSVMILIASLWAGKRLVARRFAAFGITIVTAIILVLAIFFYEEGARGFPAILSPEGWQKVIEGHPVTIFSDVTAAGTLLQILVCSLWLFAGFGYLGLYLRERRPFWAWLSLSFIVAFFSDINFLTSPSVFSVYTSQGDFMRLFSRILLFLGTYAEVSYFYRNLQVANQELQAVQEISTLGMNTSDSAKILSGINTVIQNVFNAERVVILLLDPASEKGELMVQEPAIGLTKEQKAGLKMSLSGNYLAVKVLHEGRTLTSNDARHENLPEPKIVDLLGIKTVAIAPLRTSRQTIGVIKVINKRGGAFNDDDIRFLTIIASKAATIIEHARLQKQLEATAAMEERIRLAREIHDGLAQNLGFMNLKLSQVAGCVKKNPVKAEAELADLSHIVQDTMNEARQAIVDLQTPVEGRSFVEMLTEYAREFADNTGIEARVVSETQVGGLALAARVDLLRIIQEALNNVRRHAGATDVRIKIELPNGRLKVKIIDNGKGFYSRKAETGKNRHFGIRSMKDRAAHLGGELQIQSAPGQGTTVQVEIPLQEELA